MRSALGQPRCRRGWEGANSAHEASDTGSTFQIVKAFGQCRRSHLVSDVVANGPLQSKGPFRVLRWSISGFGAKNALLGGLTAAKT